MAGAERKDDVEIKTWTRRVLVQENRETSSTPQKILSAPRHPSKRRKI